jgi:CRP-like cAMP-binding protein
MAAPLVGLVQCFKASDEQRKFKRGTTILTQGAPFNEVFLITAGIVKIYDIDVSGNERIITLFTRDNVFPLIWLFAQPPEHHIYFYEAYTDTVCLTAPKAVVREYIARRPEILLGLLDVVTRGYNNMVGRIQNLEKSQINERLHFVLYWLSNRLGTPVGEHVMRIDAPVTQSTLAGLAGVSREAMSHEINRIEGRLFWRQGPHTFIDTKLLDTDKLPTLY